VIPISQLSHKVVDKSANCWQYLLFTVLLSIPSDWASDNNHDLKSCFSIRSIAAKIDSAPIVVLNRVFLGIPLGGRTRPYDINYEAAYVLQRKPERCHIGAGVRSWEWAHAAA
jgi:hypothetical protein